MIPGEKLFGLPILWNLIQDSYPVTSESKDLLTCALESLCQILGTAQASRVRDYYLILALRNIKEGKSLYPSICVFKCIFEG